MVENATLGKLTPRQRLALESLLVTGDVSEAAAAAGVRRQSVHRWLKEAPFKAALAEAEQEKLQALSRALMRLGDRATAALGQVFDSQAAQPGAKVRAADVVLARLLQLKELTDLEERLTDLEEAMQHGQR